MANPLPIIGAAASISSTVELLGETVSALRTLQSRWKEADVAFINLISRLTALKSVLRKIQEWMETDLDEPHHLSVTELEALVTCCEVLVRRIDSELESVQQSGEMRCDAAHENKLLVKNGTLEKLQKLADRQTSALTLLLTVCNCKAISEQKFILEKVSTRKIFKRVKDDTSSLCVQRDPLSIYSRYTDNLSKISKLFEFDSEAFTSIAYEKALPGFLKSAIKNMRRKQQYRKELKVRLLGDWECAQTFIKSMKMAHSSGFTSEEREQYLEVVRRSIIHVMEAMTRILKNRDIVLDDTVKMHAKVLFQEIERIQTGDGKITLEAAGAVQGLWKCEQVVKSLLDCEEYREESSPYFIEKIQTIAQKDYLPSNADILKLGSATPVEVRIQEHRFSMGSSSLHLFDATSQRPERRNRIYSLENVTSIVFCVDLSRYDEVILEESNQNRITQSLILFDAVVNSRWFTRTSTILLLCNFGKFKEKLRSKPLGDYFPDFTGGIDATKALRFLLWQFKKAHPERMYFNWNLYEPSENSILDFVWSMVTYTLLINANRDSGFL